MLRQSYLDGTLDEKLGFDNDIPDTLIRDLFPGLFHDRD